MPQLITTAKQKVANGNGKLHPKTVRWDELTYPETVALVEKLAGPRPKIPSDLPQPEWSSQAMRVLEERYFLKDAEGKPIETLGELCWRVSWELARAEIKFGRTRREIIQLAKDYYNLLITREFLPNSPTLMNAGKGNGLQYSACYVLPVPDSLEGIFDGIKYQALVHQSGGGTGFSFSRLRPAGSRVKSSMGVASGPVSFLKVYNEATQQIKQGGMRRGANMGILRVDHPDILNFIHAKEDGGITNFNISVTITDKFMDALAKGEEYDLVAPHTGEVVSRLSAKKVWDEIAQGAWATGDPGVIFIDRINHSSASPIRADGWEVESTNPCGEQPLYPFDACNLGSIFLKYFVKDKRVDWPKLKKAIYTSVRMLDSVIEVNPFPLPQIAETVKKIRRIGLGVGGWADMLVQLEIPYDSQEALDLAEKLMRFVNEEGHKASAKLARERGAFPMWKESIYANDKPLRNSTVTTIAPTGSIGILADNSGGIEPLFAIAYQHIVKSENRSLTFINPLFEKVARERGFYTDKLMQRVAEKGTIRDIPEIPEDVRRVFGTAHEVHPDWHVKMQAAFQKYTDNAVSKTINLSHDATVADIQKAYQLAWETGCRGITVFRDGCKGDQVLNLGIKNDSIKPAINGEAAKAVQLWVRPERLPGATYKIKTPVGTAYITINEDANGNPIEVFIAIGKAGSDIAAMAEALGRLISKFLKVNGSNSAQEKALIIIDQLRGIGGRRSVGFGPNRIRSLPDAIAAALAAHFVNHNLDLNGQAPSDEPIQTNSQTAQQEESLTHRHADICPNCGEASLVLEEGCKKCYSCGHSEC